MKTFIFKKLPWRPACKPGRPAVTACLPATMLFSLVLLTGSHCAVEENPFLQKISQKSQDVRTSGNLELKILQVGVDIIATLSKSDMRRLIPDTYEGDLQGTWGRPSTLTDPGETGTGTYMNSDFKFMPIGAEFDDAEPDKNSSVCNTENQCKLVPRDDSVFLMFFELTGDGGLVENALNFIKNNPQDTTPKQEMKDLLNMTPANMPIEKVPYLGTAYTILITIAGFFGAEDSVDRMVRQGVADTYGIGYNQEVVSPQFVKEAVVRNVIYPSADGEIIKEEDLLDLDKANRSRLVVLCERDSNTGSSSSTRVSTCTNPDALRAGPRGHQFMPKPPHHVLSLGGGGPDYRDPALYHGTRVAIPVFLGDAIADFKTLAVADYKTLIDLELGNIGESNVGNPRYSFLKPVIGAGEGGGLTVTSPATEIMFNESKDSPDPAPGEYWMKLPVKVPGLALDGFDFSKSSYAGEDSLTADGILIYIGDRSAFNQCFPNENGQKMNLVGEVDVAGSQAGCVETGGSNDPTGAGMSMDNIEEDPKMSFDFAMRADQVVRTVFAAIRYQYSDKILCIGWTVYTECDFGFAIEMEPLTQDIVLNFYTPAEMIFTIENIDVGIDRTQMAAAIKSTFNGYKSDGKPVVDLGDFQGILPCDNSDPGCYYCDPLEPGFPEVCYTACTAENPTWTDTSPAGDTAQVPTPHASKLCRNTVEFAPVLNGATVNWGGEVGSDTGSVGDLIYNTGLDEYRYNDPGVGWVNAKKYPAQLTEEERLAKASAQRPLRRISDVLFDNSVGEPDMYADLLFINLNESVDDDPDGPGGADPLSYQFDAATEQGGIPVVFWKNRGGQTTRDGFFMDEALTQPICADQFKFEHCVTAEKIFVNSTLDGTSAGANKYKLGTKEGDKAAQYVNDSSALIVNNTDKTVYFQDDTGNVYRLSFFKSFNPRKINAEWERL